MSYSANLLVRLQLGNEWNVSILIALAPAARLGVIIVAVGMGCDARECWHHQSTLLADCTEKPVQNHRRASINNPETFQRRMHHHGITFTQTQVAETFSEVFRVHYDLLVGMVGRR
jgi:hypothetical protein